MDSVTQTAMKMLSEACASRHIKVGIWFASAEAVEGLFFEGERPTRVAESFDSAICRSQRYLQAFWMRRELRQVNYLREHGVAEFTEALYAQFLEDDEDHKDNVMEIAISVVVNGVLYLLASLYLLESDDDEAWSFFVSSHAALFRALHIPVPPCALEDSGEECDMSDDGSYDGSCDGSCATNSNLESADADMHGGSSSIAKRERVEFLLNNALSAGRSSSRSSSSGSSMSHVSLAHSVSSGKDSGAFAAALANPSAVVF